MKWVKRFFIALGIVSIPAVLPFARRCAGDEGIKVVIENCDLDPTEWKVVLSARKDEEEARFSEIAGVRVFFVSREGAGYKVE